MIWWKTIIINALNINVTHNVQCTFYSARFLTHQTNYLKVKKISVFFSNEGPRPLLRGGSYRINASIQTSSEENISSQNMNLEDELNIQFNIGICKKKILKRTFSSQNLCSSLQSFWYSADFNVKLHMLLLNVSFKYAV